MSEEDELEEIRKRKLQQMQEQAAQQQIAEAQQKEFEKKKYNLMRKVLSQESRQRLENIRLVRPQFAQQVELQLIQLYRNGQLRGATPLTDQTFKKLLKQLTGKKKKFNIKNL
ncbi:MAG: DNA-binding protein [Candidatus Lokiarchaeota archaeon]|nr:DNA-binding protein [Candidatus Lokiarchaeota archaeon]